MSTPRDYGTLREEHASAIEINHDEIEPVASPAQGAGGDPPQPPQAIEQAAEPEPTRPTGIYSSPGWTDRGGMEAQQASALKYNDWLQAQYDRRTNAADSFEQRSEAALEKHAEPVPIFQTDHAGPGNSEREPNVAAPQHEVGDQVSSSEQQPGERKTLRFYEDLKQEHSRDFDKENDRSERGDPGRKTLSFFEDRNPTHGDDHEH